MISHQEILATAVKVTKSSFGFSLRDSDIICLTSTYESNYPDLVISVGRWSTILLTLA